LDIECCCKRKVIIMEWQPYRWGGLSPGIVLTALDGERLPCVGEGTCSPQRSKGGRRVSSASVSGLVRQLMAAERARILRKKTIDLGRYTLGKGTRRWSPK
jgi:hypothetical protein